MSAFVKSFLIAAAMIVAMPARGVIAQSTLTTGGPNSAGRSETRKAPSDNSKADGNRGDTEARSIYMVIQTDSAMTQEELRDKFEEARKASPECSIESYDINPIDQATYVLLKSIVQSGVIPKNPASEGPVKVEPVKGKDGEWTIILEEEITMKPEPKNKANADLRYNSPGEYILKLPAGRTGKSATFTVTDDAKGGKPAELSLEFTWPDTGRCYLVKLNGVQGEEKALYDTLKDGKKISNPVKGLEEAKKAAIVVASFKEMLAVPLVFQVDAIKLTFPKPGGGVEPKRMWMRFPLTKSEAAALSKELDSKFVGDGFKTVPAWIRQNLLGEKLTPEGSTGWFELPWDADNQAFEKTLPIDTKSWQQRLVNNKEYMGDNAILIYEFEGEDGSQRIIKGDNGKYYRSEPVGGWLTGLPTAPTADK